MEATELTANNLPAPSQKLGADELRPANHVNQINGDESTPLLANHDDGYSLDALASTSNAGANVNANADLSPRLDGELSTNESSLSTVPESAATSAADAQRHSSSSSRHDQRHRKSRVFVRRFKKLDQSVLSSTPAPDVKIGQRVSYREYYGNEFGTIRWIGRVPQICPDWTVGVEFDNAIGEGDGSLNGRRYFIAKDCFAKFLPLESVAQVDQHVGRPEPGTMISVMSAAVRPGQMISIQRVSTVHVQHCFLNAPHRKPGADILAVNTRLHCQCPNCGPCAHVIKPPSTERLLKSGKNATHMCQFSTYTCCGMESQEEAMCTYTGNKISSLPPPVGSLGMPPPPLGNSWIEGSGYLTSLQEQQTKLMPEEYRFGAAPEDIDNPDLRRHLSSKTSSRRGSGKHAHPNARRSKPSPKPGAELPAADLGRPCSCCASVDATSNQQLKPTSSPLPPPPSYTPPEALNIGASVGPPIERDKNYASGDDEDATYAKPQGQRFVYRDSIENRYLFPTDEFMDSAFEADLEDLSQARYGHCASSHHTSRGLLKSLRSLVSCLSSHSTCTNHHNRSYRLAGQVNHGVIASNKSPPAVKTLAQFHDDAVINQEVLDKFEPESFASATRFSADDKSFAAPKYHQSGDHPLTATRHVSGSSDCGFSSASQNSANITSSPLCSLEDDRKLNQVYRRIVNRLLNSSFITNDDLTRLRYALDGIKQPDISPSLALLSRRDSTPCGQSSGGTDLLVSELIRKAHIQHEGCVRSSSVVYNNSEPNHCAYNSTLDILDSKFDSDSCAEQLHKWDANCPPSRDPQLVCRAPASIRGVAEGSSITDSIATTRSRSDCSITNTPECRIESERSEEGDNSGQSKNDVVQRAFELKLTLSINGEG